MSYRKMHHLCFLIIILLISCEKDDPITIIPNLRLKECLLVRDIISENHIRISHKYIYQYDDLNRQNIVDIELDTEDEYLRGTRYFYLYGKLDSVVDYWANSTVQFKFLYINDTIEIKTCHTYINGLSEDSYIGKTINILENGAVKKIIDYRQLDNSDSLYAYNYDILTWQNNNLIQMDSYDCQTDTDIWLSSTYYRYDNKINPYSRNDINKYLGINPSSKNNIVKTITTRPSGYRGERDTWYTYNEFDLPTSRIDSIGDITYSEIITRHYTYEEF